jgi:hypothetical protein
LGRKWRGRQGLDGPAAGKRKGKKEKREVGWAVGRGWIGFVFVFFFFFKPIFKPISNLFKFKSFTCFQIQILTQISPIIF